MKIKKILSLLLAVILVLSLLGGCKAEQSGADNVQQPANAKETSAHTSRAHVTEVEAYPIDLGYTEYVALVIPDELPMDSDQDSAIIPTDGTVSPSQIEEPAENPTVEEPNAKEPTMPQTEETVQVRRPGVSEMMQFFSAEENRIGETPTEEDEPNVTVFRYRETDMAAESTFYRLQVQKLEAEGTTVFCGTLYPDTGVIWDTGSDMVLRTKLDELLLQEIEWSSCTQDGVYAHNLTMKKCVVCDQDVIYTNMDQTAFQIQKYHPDGSLYSVAVLTPGSTQLLLNDSLSALQWEYDPNPVLYLSEPEQPAYDEAQLQNQILAGEEQIQNLNREIAESQQFIKGLYLVVGVLVLSNAVCLILLLCRKRRHAKRKQTERKTEQSARIAGIVQNIGTVHNIGGRSGQQDSFDVINCSAGTLAVVADGMGGLADGDKVSQKIVATMRADSARIRPGKTDSILCQMVAHANQEVNRMLGASRQYKCGSTLLAVLIEGGTMQWITVGDSRIYLYRGGRLLQINREHIYYKELLERAINGKISFAEAMQDPQAERLSSFVGMGELKHVDICLNRLKLCAGDRILLMSDGVFNTLNEDEIAETIQSSENASNAARLLEEKVLKKNAPNQDNFTCVILEV